MILFYNQFFISISKLQNHKLLHILLYYLDNKFNIILHMLFII